MKDILEIMVNTAYKAGEILLNSGEIVLTIKEGHANFVTQCDRKIQEFIFERLKNVVPSASFIGEEEGADKVGEDHDLSFCVDPIDGTTNFIKGYSPSVISIALLSKRKPVLATVYNPFSRECYTAQKNHGAFLNNVPIISSKEPLENSLVSFGTSPYYPEMTHETFLLCEHYLKRSVDLRRSGSAAFDICQVAAGKTGLFFEKKLGLWDYAAATLIAEEAQCKVTDIYGELLSYNGYSSVLCASRGIAKENYLPFNY